MVKTATYLRKKPNLHSTHSFTNYISKHIIRSCKFETDCTQIKQTKIWLGGIQQLRGPNFDQFRPPPPLEWTSVDFLQPPPLSTWTKGGPPKI